MLKSFTERLIFKGTGSQKGMILAMVMAFVLLMGISAVSFTTILKRDIELIGRAKLSEQAKNVAEGGVHHALAKLLTEGFSSRADFNGSLDTGTYSVTYTDIGGRTLVTSVGTVLGVSRTVTAEVKSNFPEALTKMFAGGNDVKARVTSDSASVSITGDIHANNDVELRALGAGQVTILGDVSAVGIVQEGSKHDQADSIDDGVFINGANNDAAAVLEGQNRISYPEFEYDVYKQEAIDSGDYYNSNQTFNGVTLSPGNGVIYVDGNVTIRGTCTLNGGLIADDINIEGTLIQNKSGNRNLIIARNKDVSIFTELTTEEAIVYAKRDLRTRAAGTVVDITGIVLAERDMSFWNVQTNVTYTYKLTHPSDLPGTSEEDMIQVVSWNR